MKNLPFKASAMILLVTALFLAESSQAFQCGGQNYTEDPDTILLCTDGNPVGCKNLSVNSTTGGGGCQALNFCYANGIAWDGFFRLPVGQQFTRNQFCTYSIPNPPCYPLMPHVPTDAVQATATSSCGGTGPFAFKKLTSSGGHLVYDRLGNYRTGCNATLSNCTFSICGCNITLAPIGVQGPAPTPMPAPAPAPMPTIRRVGFNIGLACVNGLNCMQINASHLTVLLSGGTLVSGSVVVVPSSNSNATLAFTADLPNMTFADFVVTATYMGPQGGPHTGITVDFPISDTATTVPPPAGLEIQLGPPTPPEE